MPNTLKLTLHRKAFEVMVTGEKKKEFREISQWIQSRLYKSTKPGKRETKPYSAVEFTNGYGANKPRFTCKYLGFTKESWVREQYSNGLLVDVPYPLYALHLGEILSIENYTIPATPQP